MSWCSLEESTGLQWINIPSRERDRERRLKVAREWKEGRAIAHGRDGEAREEVTGK